MITGSRVTAVCAGRGSFLTAAAVPSLVTGKDVAVLLLVAVLAAGVYLGSCLIWPYARCLACLGRKGRNPGSNKKRHGRCPACKGAGERLRIGTRLIRAYRGGRWPR